MPQTALNQINGVTDMENERESKWLRIDDADILMLLDVHGEGSEIEVTHDDGAVYGCTVPVLDERGYPTSGGGRYPNMDDLERFSAELVAYVRPIQGLGIDGRTRLAMEMNSSVNEKSSTAEWIELLKAAEENGMDIGRTDTPERRLAR